jgi:hypothetical protein
MSRTLLIVLALSACSKRSTTTTTTTPPPNPSGGASTDTSSQTPPPVVDNDAECPSIQVKAPDSVSQGTKATISASLVGGSGQPTYKWTLSAGSVASGQGSATVTADTKGLSGQSVTATLTVGGLPTKCATTTASATFLVGP